MCRETEMTKGSECMAREQSANILTRSSVSAEVPPTSLSQFVIISKIPKDGRKEGILPTD